MDALAHLSVLPSDQVLKHQVMRMAGYSQEKKAARKKRVSPVPQGRLPKASPGVSELIVLALVSVFLKKLTRDTQAEYPLFSDTIILPYFSEQLPGRGWLWKQAPCSSTCL